MKDSIVSHLEPLRELELLLNYRTRLTLLPSVCLRSFLRFPRPAPVNLLLPPQIRGQLFKIKLL